MEKRRHMPDVKIEKINGDLSVTSVEDFWKMHNQEKGRKIYE